MNEILIIITINHHRVDVFHSRKLTCYSFSNNPARDFLEFYWGLFYSNPEKSSPNLTLYIGIALANGVCLLIPPNFKSPKY